MWAHNLWDKGIASKNPTSTNVRFPSQEIIPRNPAATIVSVPSHINTC